MTVRAKFRCTEIKRQTWPTRDGDGRLINDEVQALTLVPVHGNGDPEHENTKFYASTPGGQIHLALLNMDAAKQFELNGEYYVDFTPAA